MNGETWLEIGEGLEEGPEKKAAFVRWCAVEMHRIGASEAYSRSWARSQGVPCDEIEALLGNRRAAPVLKTEPALRLIGDDDVPRKAEQVYLNADARYGA